MTILFIGGGNMGSAILIRAAKQNKGTRFGVVDPNIDAVSRKLPSGLNVRFWTDPTEITGFEPELVVLAVKPQIFKLVAQNLRGKWPSAVIVSIMAGVSIDTIGKALGTDRVTRIMPNLPAVIGQGISVGYSETLSKAEIAMVQQLILAVGELIWLDEENQIDACTAVSGSGPGYLFAFAEHLENAARTSGIPDAIAKRLVNSTIDGAAAMLIHDERPAASMKKAVRSKGGTTEAGLTVLEAPGGLPDLLEAAVRAAHQRAAQLSQGD